MGGGPYSHQNSLMTPKADAACNDKHKTHYTAIRFVIKTSLLINDLSNFSSI